MDRVLETVLERTAKDGTPFRVTVEDRTGTVVPVAYLDGKQLAVGNTVGWPLPAASHRDGLTHAAGYPPARIIGLTDAEAATVKAAVRRHHEEINAVAIAAQHLDAKLGGLLEDFSAARERRDFDRARVIESEIAATRKAAGLPAGDWRE
ncbi:hypothetical protein [Myxococcus sp. CA040A]|uniref:hypothetical protein n=1 Tax=Myxococcus sp. CA040A TaxID=2741738 RepID=UPI00157A8DDD|nr:hypothetical protein [Myxococcus sp. CA040A]NTX07024.1 hypothetical protein [Myxococcus sp. CA040A]